MTIDEPKPNNEKSQKNVKKQSTHAKKTTSTINSTDKTLSCEFKGTALVSANRDNDRFGPDGKEAYALIIKYFEQFLE